MKNTFIVSKEFWLLAFLTISTLLYAQSEPRWYDLSSRNMFYPSSEYYTGYSEDVRDAHVTLEAQLKQISDMARTELMASVQIKVKSITNSYINSTQYESSNQEMSQELLQLFEMQTQTSVNMQLPGIKIETWQNSTENTVVAFAYVRKADLINHFDKQITVSIVRLENALQNIAQMEAIGQKTDARKLAETSIKHVTDIEYAQRILLAIDESKDTSKLQTTESNRLKQQLLHKISELQHSLTIYLQCNADIFGGTYSTLEGELKGELSKLGCSFVNALEGADYVVEIKASSREYSHVQMNGMNQYFAYVDANITITKGVTQQRIYEDELSVKGGHTHNYAQAARTAYKSISKELASVIKGQIK